MSVFNSTRDSIGTSGLGGIWSGLHMLEMCFVSFLGEMDTVCSRTRANQLKRKEKSSSRQFVVTRSQERCCDGIASIVFVLVHFQFLAFNIHSRLSFPATSMHFFLQNKIMQNPIHKAIAKHEKGPDIGLACQWSRSAPTCSPDHIVLHC